MRDTIAPDSLGNSTDNWINPADAAVRFEYEMVSFEQIKKGEAVIGRFAFSNISQETLEIELVSTCDCIISDWTTDPILPNQMGEVLFKLDTAQEDLGALFKHVDVIFKNTDTKGYPLVKQLYVKALLN